MFGVRKQVGLKKVAAVKLCEMSAISGISAAFLAAESAGIPSVMLSAVMPAHSCIWDLQTKGGDTNIVNDNQHSKLSS